MKAPAFRYHRPASLADALDIRAALPEARLLAGGQSLMPMLNLRLLFPDDLIDLNRVRELDFIRDEDGEIHIGAMTRQRALERAPVIKTRLPLLAEALAQVGHAATRNRGTIGGSLCHLDPAAELPVVALAHDAELRVQRRGGARRIAMAAFPQGPMSPAIAPDEIMTAIAFRPWRPAHGAAFVEFARRRGDFAVVSAAVLVEPDDDGRIGRVAIALGGMGLAPLRASEAERLLLHCVPDEEAIAAASAGCATLAAIDDPHAPAWYRQRLAATLVRRALGLACRRAGLR